MGKRQKLATRALGAEPGRPDVTALAAWVAEHRGRTADITTYLLNQSLAPQIPAGIGMPCAGGRFYADRLLASITGIEDQQAVSELHADTPVIIEDAAGIVVQRKGAWCAVPAPHVLSLTDAYYRDGDEWSDALSGTYRTILRAMRDTGVAGHVLICDRADEDECAALAGQKVFFFPPAPTRDDLMCLLEYQHRIAVGAQELPVLLDLTNEFTVGHLVLVDPDPYAIELARSQFDPDQITVAGYCTGDSTTYWGEIVAHAECER